MRPLTGRPDDAILGAKRVLGGYPNAVGAPVILGTAYLQKRKLDSALAHLQKALAVAPDRPEVYLSLGTVYYQKGMMAQAEESYRKAIALAPNDPGGFNNLAWLFGERKTHLDEALQPAKQANELASNRGELLDTLGWVYFQKEMCAEAVEALKAAAGILPQDLTIRFHLGLVHWQQGRKAAELRRALLIDPNFPKASRTREVLAALGG